MKQLAIVDMATLHIKVIVVFVRNVNKGKKNMKANELMIGDWVNHKGIYNYIATADFDYNHRKWIEEIEPIPLTEEILKKNGFVNKDNEWLHYCDFPFIDFILNKDSDGFYIDCIYTPNGYIQYVHELQHAFKLFKVDGEIII